MKATMHRAMVAAPVAPVRVGVSSQRVMELIGAEAYRCAFECEHSDAWSFGIHHYWTGAYMITPEGLALMVEALYVADLKPEALILRVVIDELVAERVRLSPGTPADRDPVLEHRWDLKEAGL